MDRRVKERLVGASILLLLIVLIVPELLSGPAPAIAGRPLAAGRPAASAPEAVRNITVDLATSKASATEPADAAGSSSAEPPVTQTAAASTAAGADSRGDEGNGAPAAVPATPRVPAGEKAAPSPRVETASQAPTISTARPAGGAWAVQLGSFASRANADKLMHQLRGQGFPAYVASGGSGSSLRYRVRVGPLADRAAAAQTAAKLKALGHSSSFVPPAR